MSPVKVRKPYHHGALRQALLDEAFRALEEGGLESLSLRDLAARTGVSKTAPYRHFQDKGALLVAMAAEGFRMLADSLEAVLQEHAMRSLVSEGLPATAGIRSLFRAYLEFARSRPALYRLMLSPHGSSLRSEGCRTHSMRGFNCFVRAVEHARSQGWRRNQETMPIVLCLVAEAHGWARLLIDDVLPQDLVPAPEALEKTSESLLE